MRFLHRDVEYDLDDTWWVEAGMSGFVPQQPAFRSGPSDIAGRSTFELSVGEVRPLRRKLSHGVFNNSISDGLAHDRVVRILKGFKAGDAIPPVHVARTTGGAVKAARIVIGLVAASVMTILLWDPFVGSFIHRDRNRGEIRALYQALAPGMTREEVSRLLDAAVGYVVHSRMDSRSTQFPTADGSGRRNIQRRWCSVIGRISGAWARTRRLAFG
jgi:hypothetical protein